MDPLDARPQILAARIWLVTGLVTSVLVAMLFYVNLRPNNEAPMPLPTLSGSEEVAGNYSYLDALDRMRSGSSKPARRAGGGRFSVGKPTVSTSRSTPAPRSPAPTVQAPRRSGGGAIPSPAPRRAGGGTFGAPAQVSSTPPVRSRPPARNTGGGGGTMASLSGGGGGGGGTWNYGSVSASPTGQYGGAPLGGGGAGGFSAMSAPMPAPMSDEEYLPTDSIYVSEAAGINADVQALLDSLKRDRASYDVDFGAALRNLGWDLGEEGLSNPGQGQWRQQDMTGAYGSAYNNQQNDYAGRGMLTSSFYGKALEDLLSSFDRQRGDMIGARQRQFDDFTAQESEAETQKRQGLDRARASALARRAAGLSLGGF